MSAARLPAGEAMATRDLLAALAVVVIWGLNFVVMKWGLRYFTPFQLGAVRYLFAALPLVFFLKPPRVHWRWVLLFGLFQGVGQFGFGFFALKLGMTAALASVLMQTQVFFTALFAFGILRERPRRPLVLGMAIAAVGLVCFAMNFIGPGAKGTGVGGATLVGICLTLCAASCWAVSNIVSRLAQQESPGYNPLSFVAWSSLVPVLPFMGLTAVTDADAGRWLHADAWAALPPIAWAAAAYLGWVATIVGYGLWTGLLTRYPANRVAPFSLGVPVVGLAAGLLALGEVVTAWQWAGVACVVMALVCVVLGPRYSGRRRA
ncbi:EamA family transporter [Paracidovorax valerianellae]|uniref:EamA family transporter n=1 Tax=Paracidovorax valerianellae TaxID=187868 RepID=UPI002303B7A7|nr:EamA family transporter [Paracidovorax valerianellae]MDA8446014.1 EamA family transporter [Paracidovorax valerianellae]